MKGKAQILEIIMVIVLGFFTGTLLGNGSTIQENGIYILLGWIFWILMFIYLRLPAAKGDRESNEK